MFQQNTDGTMVLAYEGSAEFSGDRSPSGSVHVPVFAGSSHKVGFTIEISAA